MNWKFKEKIPDEALYSEEFWYDITLGGYINPREILDDKEQIKNLLEAIAIVQSFENALDELLDDFIDSHPDPVDYIKKGVINH